MIVELINCPTFSFQKAVRLEKHRKLLCIFSMAAPWKFWSLVYLNKQKWYFSTWINRNVKIHRFLTAAEACVFLQVFKKYAFFVENEAILRQGRLPLFWLWIQIKSGEIPFTLGH